MLKYLLTSLALQASMSSFLKSKDKFKLPENYRGRDHTVRAKLIELASQDEPFLDLSQDIPEVTAPKLVTEALANVALSDDPLLQQYSRGQGHVRLVNVLSTLYSYVIGRKIDPLTEVITTAGAHEALYSAISGHVHPGEEVILIEPYFDCYEPMVKAAGGRSVFVPLKPRKTTGEIRSSDWVFDPSEMTAAFNEKTKAIIVNTPHKHLGKVFTRDELLFISDLCKKWNVMVISDEVYEWMVFEPSRHIRMASLPGMWDLTVTIGSGGKMFSVTGWKIGWAYGPNRLIHNLQVVHQNNLDSINTPTQEALAHCLELELCRIHNENCYLTSLARELKPNRDFMASFFTQIGMVPTIPDAGFFMMVDWTPLESIVGMDVVTGGHKDYRFAKWLMKNHNILGIPLSTEFYSVPHKNLGESYIRFCYFKEKKALQKAEQILKAWVSGQESSMM